MPFDKFIQVSNELNKNTTYCDSFQRPEHLHPINLTQALTCANLMHKCSKKVLPHIDPALPHYRQHRPRTVERADGCSVLLLLLLPLLVILTIPLSSPVLLLLGKFYILPLQHL
jgi:hypothetical protein